MHGERIKKKIENACGILKNPKKILETNGFQRVLKMEISRFILNEEINSANKSLFKL